MECGFGCMIIGESIVEFHRVFIKKSNIVNRLDGLKFMAIRENGFLILRDIYELSSALCKCCNLICNKI